MIIGGQPLFKISINLTGGFHGLLPRLSIQVRVLIDHNRNLGVTQDTGYASDSVESAK